MTRRSLRIGLITIAGLLVAVVAAGAIAIARFDPDSLKPRIIAAVRQATGRQLVLQGPISLHPSLWPTAVLHDVAFANPPGFSRPDMATLQRLDIQLALWPLISHQVRIERLVLVRPDIRLETNAQGSDNWRFTPASASSAPPSQAVSAPVAPAGNPTRISVGHVRIRDATVSYRNDITGRSRLLTVQRLDASTTAPHDRLTISADGAYDHAAFRLTATLGPVERLFNGDAGTPWPIQATVQAGSARLTVDGSMRHPRRGAGYDVAVIGNVPDLATLAPFVPGTKLPPLHDLRFSAKLADRGGSLPRLSMVTLHAGASDLDMLRPGLRLETADLTAPSLDHPMHVRVQARLENAPVSLAGTLGPVAALLGTATQPYPVDLSGTVGGGRPTMTGAAPTGAAMTGAAMTRVTMKGSIARPRALKGVDLRLDVQAPDLAALSPLAHRPLPPLKSVAFMARLTDGSAGLAKGVALHDIKLTMPAADVTGDMTLVPGSPPDVTARLAAGQVDADRLLAAFRSVGAPARKAAPAPAQGRSAPAPHGSKTSRLLPDTPLPFALLRKADANVSVTVKALKSGGVLYRAVRAHLLLHDGHLKLDPFSATAPQGHVRLTFAADGTPAAPPVALTLRAPSVALAPLLAALHQPAYASGNMELRADLRGAGASPRAIAAGLDGTVGLALAHGTLDTRLLEKSLGPALAKSNLLTLLGQGGSSQVKCFALRIDMRHGIGQVRALALNSSLLSLDGGGSVNLRDETMSLALRPQGRVGGTGFVVPVRVAGPLRSPQVAVNATGAVASDIGSLVGALGGSSQPLAQLAGALTGGRAVGQGVSCAGPLALARGQKPPAQPAAAAPQPAAKPAPQSAPQPPNPADLLRQLFH